MTDDDAEAIAELKRVLAPRDLDYGLVRVPDYMHGGLARWVLWGIPPGDFLWAVICNDLKGAVGRADVSNQHALLNWVRLFYSDMPEGCWGSPEKARVWEAKGGLKGRAA